MKKLVNFLILVLTFVATQQLFANELSSPVGFWKTIDDVTGQPKAIVQIWETPEKKLFGRVLKIFAKKDQNELCTACVGDKKNKHIVGMVILENLQKVKDQKDKWSDGLILDPKNGKTYNCSVQITENGDKLNARGYIGLPLFGRTQTWHRVPDPQTVA